MGMFTVFFKSVGTKIYDHSLVSRELSPAPATTPTAATATPTTASTTTTPLWLLLGGLVKAPLPWGSPVRSPVPLSPPLTLMGGPGLALLVRSAAHSPDA